MSVSMVVSHAAMIIYAARVAGNVFVFVVFM
jgi:hypothetical protein